MIAVDFLRKKNLFNILNDYNMNEHKNNPNQSDPIVEMLHHFLSSAPLDVNSDRADTSHIEEIKLNPNVSPSSFLANELYIKMYNDELHDLNKIWDYLWKLMHKKYNDQDLYNKDTESIKKLHLLHFIADFDIHKSARQWYVRCCNFLSHLKDNQFGINFDELEDSLKKLRSLQRYNLPNWPNLSSSLNNNSNSLKKRGAFLHQTDVLLCILLYSYIDSSNNLKFSLIKADKNDKTSEPKRIISERMIITDHDIINHQIAEEPKSYRGTFPEFFVALSRKRTPLALVLCLIGILLIITFAIYWYNTFDYVLNDAADSISTYYTSYAANYIRQMFAVPTFVSAMIQGLYLTDNTTNWSKEQKLCQVLNLEENNGIASITLYNNDSSFLSCINFPANKNLNLYENDINNCLISYDINDQNFTKIMNTKKDLGCNMPKFQINETILYNNNDTTLYHNKLRGYEPFEYSIYIDNDDHDDLHGFYSPIYGQLEDHENHTDLLFPFYEKIEIANTNQWIEVIFDVNFCSEHASEIQNTDGIVTYIVTFENIIICSSSTYITTQINATNSNAIIIQETSKLILKNMVLFIILKKHLKNHFLFHFHLLNIILL